MSLEIEDCGVNSCKALSPETMDPDWLQLSLGSIYSASGPQQNHDPSSHHIFMPSAPMKEEPLRQDLGRKVSEDPRLLQPYLHNLTTNWPFNNSALHSWLGFSSPESILKPKSTSIASWRNSILGGPLAISVSFPKPIKQDEKQIRTFPTSPHKLEPKLRLAKPSRGHAGLWFTLQAAPNKSDGLPSIKKPFIRIKDGKMPISMVKQFLVARLGLTNELEVDITCRGQLVRPNLSVQHVRDAIWLSEDLHIDEAIHRFRSDGDDIEASSKDHIMILMYQHHTESKDMQKSAEMS